MPDGLSLSDRKSIAASVAREGVSSKFRARECVIKYARAGASDRKPMSIISSGTPHRPGSLAVLKPVSLRTCNRAVEGNADRLQE